MDKQRIIETIDNTTTGEQAPTGGDRDSDRYLAKVVGEEAVGGTTPTPDQDNVEEVAASTGIEFSDTKPIQVTKKLQERDRHRWQLDPASENRPNPEASG